MATALKYRSLHQDAKKVLSEISRIEKDRTASEAEAIWNKA